MKFLNREKWGEEKSRLTVMSQVSKSKSAGNPRSGYFPQAHPSNLTWFHTRFGFRSMFGIHVPMQLITRWPFATHLRHKPVRPWFGWGSAHSGHLKKPLHFLPLLCPKPTVRGTHNRQVPSSSLGRPTTYIKKVNSRGLAFFVG